MTHCDPLFAWNVRFDDYDIIPKENCYRNVPYHARNILKYGDTYASALTFQNIPKPPSPLSQELEIEVEKPVNQPILVGEKIVALS